MISDLLADAGIHSETLTRGKFPHMNDLTVPLEEAGREKLEAQIEHVYREFVDRVAAGRKMTAEQVNEVGRGRVWTGKQALEQGLVDELGGLWDAVDAAKELAGLDPQGEAELVFYPRPKSVLERVAESMTMQSASLQLPEPFAGLVRQLALPFAPGTVLAIMPWVVDIR